MPAVIISIFIFSLKSKTAGLNSGSNKQKIATAGLAEKYICKNCQFEGPYESFKTQNNLFFKCPKCNAYYKTYAQLNDGQMVKVAHLTSIAIFIIIAIIIALSIFLD